MNNALFVFAHIRWGTLFRVHCTVSYYINKCRTLYTRTLHYSYKMYMYTHTWLMTYFLINVRKHCIRTRSQVFYYEYLQSIFYGINKELRMSITIIMLYSEIHTTYRYIRWILIENIKLTFFSYILREVMIEF